MKRKIFIILIILSLLIILSGCNEKAPSTAKLLKQSNEYYSSVENFQTRSIINMNMLMPDITGGNMSVTFNIESDSTIFDNPLKARTIINMNHSIKGNTEGTSESIPTIIEQYFVTDGDNYILYQYSLGKWIKIKIDNELIAMKQLQGYDYIKQYENYFSDGKIIGTDTINGIETYKTQFKINKENILEIFNQFELNRSLPYDTNMEDIAIKLADSIDNIVYEVWFSKENPHIVKISSDLKPMFESIVKILTEEDSTENKASIETMFGDMSSVTEIYFTNINECEDFEIPKEALNAEESPYGY